MKRTALYIFALFFILIILIGIFSVYNTKKILKDEREVSQTNKILFEMEHLASHIKDISLFHRTYILTGNPQDLANQNIVYSQIDEPIAQLHSLMKDSTSIAYLNQLISSIHLYIEEFNEKMVKVRKGKEFGTENKSSINSNNHKLILQDIPNLITKIEDREKKLLTERQVASNNTANSGILVIVFGTVFSIIIVLIALYIIIIDIKKRVKLEKELLGFRKAISTSSEVIFITDMDGIITYINPGFTNLYGYTSEEIIGKTTPRIIKSGLLKPSEYKEFWKNLLRNKELRREIINKKKDGSTVEVEAHSNAISDDHNNIIGFLGIQHDITKRKQMENELKIATQRAEESSMLKEAFLANMSHEIRTPMNAIIGFADLLSKSELDEKESEYVEAITIAGENLLIIINDILDLSKIESGMMTFESKPFSVKETFKSLNVMLRVKAKEKNIKLSFICDDDVPDVLLGDATRLIQIITNLAGNAIKFTQKGSVQVYAKVLETVNENTAVEFSIIDTGIGIHEDKIEKIFERFRQAESHITRKYGGTGLGLSIAKQLVELQGGTLSVKSKYKVGSVFSFSILYKKSSQVLVASEITVKKYNVEDLSRLNILLVENNQLNIKLILNLFSKYNLKLEIAENGNECIEKLKQNNFDIILMDMEMPVMNGYEATTIIRTEMKNNIPIIAMTAHAIAGERERCLKIGMNDYISKPINANLLFEKMYNLTIDTNSKIIDKSDESKEFIVGKESVCDFRYLSETMNGEKHSIKEIMDVFLEQIHEELLGINDAVKKTDYSIIRNYAHTMKSTVSIMGISILAPVLKEMENLSSSATDGSTPLTTRIEKITELNKKLNLICNKAIQEIEIEKLNYV